MKKMCLLLFACLLLVASSLSQNFSQKVVRIIPQNNAELETLSNLIQQESIDVWKYPTTLGKPVDILLSDDQSLKSLLSSFEVVEILIEDLSTLLENQFDGQSRKLNQSSSYFYLDAFQCYDTYLSYTNIIAYVQNLVSNNPTISRIVSIGRSYENREIIGIEISVPSDNAKRGIYIDSAIHAREWISPAVNLNILLNLLVGYNENDPQVVDILSKFDVTIVPVLNVDGYTFTWTTNRMWRKTRRVNSDGSYGVDMNRNSDVFFCERGASRTPSSDTYCGPYANSEPELVATFNYIQNLGNVLVYWNLHSYGQELIIPYAYDHNVVTPDRDDHLRAGNLFWDGIYRATGVQYDGPRPPNGIYSGFAMDYIYRDLEVKYSGLIELRDTGSYGFILPESQICPNSLEIWEGLKLHVLFAAGNP